MPTFELKPLEVFPLLCNFEAAPPYFQDHPWLFRNQAKQALYNSIYRIDIDAFNTGARPDLSSATNIAQAKVIVATWLNSLLRAAWSPPNGDYVTRQGLEIVYRKVGSQHVSDQFLEIRDSGTLFKSLLRVTLENGADTSQAYIQILVQITEQ